MEKISILSKIHIPIILIIFLSVACTNSNPTGMASTNTVNSGQQYDFIIEITEIGGKTAFVAGKNGEEFVVFDGVEGKHYSGIKKFCNV